MQVGGALSSMNISASGMAAERLRMEVVANNIANANSTRTAEGGPYRRMEVLFAAAFDSASGSSQGGGHGLGGVQVVGLQPDLSALPRVYQPGHPDADGNGQVVMPNVKLPNEMVDLITASRSYEANLRALRTFREMAEQALSLLRGTT
jgi:flagellar basal-body rod protein FlgC